MQPGTIRAHVLVLAAYLLAAILPVFALSAGLAQSDAQHAQMMAMAGHTVPMESAGQGDEAAEMLLCQQHCMLITAALPTPVPAQTNVFRISDIVVDLEWLAPSLAVPPPGPPPKVAVI